MSDVGLYLPDDVPGFHLDQLRPEVFPLPKPKNPMLPTRRTTTRMTGIESPGLKLYTDEGSKRQVDGGELAGWRLAAASPDNFV